MNQQPALLQAPSKSNAGTKESGPKSERQEKRNKMEKDRRDRERHQLGRITCLFKVASSGKPWSRKDALSLGKILFHVVECNDHLQNSFQVSCSLSMAPAPSIKAPLRLAPPLRPYRYP